MCCFPAFFHLKPKCAALRRNNFLPPNHLYYASARQRAGGRAADCDEETERHKMEIRDGEGQKSRERVIEFVSIFSGRVTIGTTFPCSTSFSAHTHTFFFFCRVQGFAPPVQGVLDYRKMLITVQGEQRRKLEHTACPVIVIY